MPQLSLVDLAGSERVGKTGATADQLKVCVCLVATPVPINW